MVRWVAGVGAVLCYGIIYVPGGRVRKSNQWDLPLRMDINNGRTFSVRVVYDFFFFFLITGCRGASSRAAVWVFVLSGRWDAARCSAVPGGCSTVLSVRLFHMGACQEASTASHHLAWVGVNEHFNHPAKWQRLLGRLCDGLPYGWKERRGEKADPAGCWTAVWCVFWLAEMHPDIPNVCLDWMPFWRVFELLTMRHWPTIEVHTRLCATLETNKKCLFVFFLFSCFVRPPAASNYCHPGFQQEIIMIITASQRQGKKWQQQKNLIKKRSLLVW